MAPGDVYLMNDPFRGGVHANDMQVFSLDFLDGVPRYQGGSRVHVADGVVPAEKGLSIR
jgi:N-methylhydantoinase B